ncbi:Protein CBG26354 [Caenorhabditis briggsae]|uniref:Protein CBG26354 n=1 Tax=Caenorhabditis briggsae TaxID=6238 RepID=B6IGC5_CAEBR|nr:Protein CBG26354 [Caenorhabditis briggsae]CAR98955.1 Protein CBG26354 [Caenorhabditis briggsae]
MFGGKKGKQIQRTERWESEEKKK